MATVFRNSMVAHVWAQQSQPEGRSNNGQFYFSGPTIYSYGTHFPIASFVEHKGRQAVLFTTRNYSPTTGGHKSTTSGAIKIGTPRFYVYDPSQLNHHGRREEFARRVAEKVAEVARLRGRNSEYAMTAAFNAATQANEYAAFFGLRWRLKLPHFSPEFITKIKAQAAKEAARKAAATRARNAKEEAALQDAVKRFRAGEFVHTPWQLKPRLTDDDYVEHERNRAPVIAAEIAAWRAGAHRIEVDETLLRVRGDQVETSRGAEFPVDHAKRAFRLIAQCRANGGAWQRNGHSIHLGHFQIDRIEANGDVRAGCHLVKWDEIARCATELGLDAAQSSVA